MQDRETNRPTVHLVDDDDFARGIVAEMLQPLGYPVEGHPSAEDFLAALHPGLCGCLVLDMRLPGMQGTALQAELRRLGVRLPIIFLSGHQDVPATVTAIKAGAEDCLLKPADRVALRQCVMAAMARDRAMRVAEASSEDARARLNRLTAREREILALALAGHTNKEIARRLEVSHRTVETHRARIFLKTDAGNLLRLAQMATACGFLAGRAPDAAGDPGIPPESDLPAGPGREACSAGWPGACGHGGRP